MNNPDFLLKNGLFYNKTGARAGACVCYSALAPCAGDCNFTLKMMNFTLKMMNFVLKMMILQGLALAEGKGWGAAVLEYDLGLVVEGMEDEELTAELVQARADALHNVICPHPPSDALSQRDTLPSTAKHFLEKGADELGKKRFSEALAALRSGLAVEFTEDGSLTEALETENVKAETLAAAANAYVWRCCLLCIYMPEIDRPLSALYIHAGD